MFTGIVTDIGEILAVHGEGDRRLRLACGFPADGIALGASIACDGVCLTMVGRGQEGGRNWFEVDASAETLALTTLGDWQTGTQVNLERSLRVGDELGGHIVSGHIDGLAEIIAMRDEGDSTRFSFEVPEALARYIAPKGSVALNGTSLTVNEVEGRSFGVNMIPHTKAITTWGTAKTGDKVNLEIDVLARYVARLGEVA
ncbi:MAG: riboflavin synthase [Pseudomonadota bacterium]